MVVSQLTQYMRVTTRSDSQTGHFVMGLLIMAHPVLKITLIFYSYDTIKINIVNKKINKINIDINITDLGPLR